MIERARAKWEDEPKYPAHVRPAPRPSVGLGVDRGRCRPGPPRKGQTNSSQSRPDCSRAGWERLGRWPHQW